MASAWEGVCVGTGNVLTAAPTWTRLDAGQAGLRCTGITIERGKQSVFEKTGTGTCTVTFNDRSGLLDPTVSASLLSKPFAVAIRNPVTDEWFSLFRGIVDEAGLIMNRHTLKLEVGIVAVDLFDYFANIELIPGTGYVNAQVNASGYVFYEDAGFDERVLAILEDTGLPSALYSVFTGNIVHPESIYAAGDRVLQALEEAVDAELPTVANHYVDRSGRYQVHGRYARFDPDGVSASASNWDFERWKVGDNAAAAADADRAKMQEPYGFGEQRSDIRNAALCFPQGVDQSDLSSFVFTDTTSRDTHGTRTWTAPNLQVFEETTIGMTGKEFCLMVAEYIVENYKNPVPRLPAVTVGTEHPTHGDYGPAAWDYMCRSDISDIVNVKISHPGGGGFNEVDHFIEGIKIDIRPGPGDLDTAYPIIKHTADLSGAAFWDHNPFGALP